MLKQITLERGIEWAARKPETKFSFQVLVDGKDKGNDYLYKITVKNTPTVQVVDKSWTLIDSQNISDSNSSQQLFLTPPFMMIKKRNNL